MPRNTVERLPIRTICALTGVKAMTLRAWERRYGLIKPQRTPKGHRVYTHAHVERLRRVLTLIDRGVPVSRVRELLDAEPAATAGAAGPWTGYLDRMAAAVTRFDELELDQVHDEALSLHPIERVTRQLYLPLLVRLGGRWHDIDGGIAEEHFLAMYLRSKLGARLQHRMRYATGPRLLAACAPGEQHEIGLLLFALEANGVGMRTVLLGADTPLSDIGIACRRSGCAAVVIASSVDPEPGLLDDALRELVSTVRVPVFVGGATAARHRGAITKAGAVALASDLEDGVRTIATSLNGRSQRT